MHGDPPSPPTSIGSYELVEELGRGGSALVYEGRHRLLGHRVAVKVIRAGSARDRAWRTRFLREAAALKAIDHQGIVEILDVGSEGGAVYLVMEYLEGETLSDRLQRERVSAGEAVEIARAIASALGAAHRLDIIHRDLKPTNIILCENAAGSLEPKVIDFGLAKRVGHSAAMTRAGVFLGTPEYASPEQCSGDGAIDERTDIYSLGVVLYQMLSGSTPFCGVDSTEILTEQQFCAPPPLDAPGLELAPDLEFLVMRCLDKDPSRRYPSMAELEMHLARLAALLRDEEREAPCARAGAPAAADAPPTRETSTKVWLPRSGRQRRTRVQLAAVLMVAVITGAVARVYLEANAGDEPRGADLERRFQLSAALDVGAAGPAGGEERTERAARVEPARGQRASRAASSRRKVRRPPARRARRVGAGAGASLAPRAAARSARDGRSAGGAGEGTSAERPAEERPAPRDEPDPGASVEDYGDVAVPALF